MSYGLLPRWAHEAPFPGLGPAQPLPPGVRLEHVPWYRLVADRPSRHQPGQALGYDVEIDTPLGTRTVSFDLEKVSDDVTTQLIADAWPKVEDKARAALPAFVNQAVTHARPDIERERDMLVGKLALLTGMLAVSVIGAAYYVGAGGAQRSFA